MEWIKTAKKQFKRFRYELKLEKRRKKENLSHHSLEKAKNNFEELMRHTKTFDEAIQKRLRMINSHWLNLTLFHYLPGAPVSYTHLTLPTILRVYISVVAVSLNK